MKHRRPFSVTLLAWLVLIVTVMNLTRLTLALLNWGFLAELLPISPVCQTLSGLFWGLAGLPLLWGLWRGEGWAPIYWWAASVSYSLYYWADRLLLPSFAGRNINWPFALGVNLLLLFFGFGVLSRNKARNFFGVMHERESENPGST